MDVFTPKAVDSARALDPSDADFLFLWRLDEVSSPGVNGFASAPFLADVEDEDAGFFLVVVDSFRFLAEGADLPAPLERLMGAIVCVRRGDGGGDW